MANTDILFPFMHEQLCVVTFLHLDTRDLNFPLIKFSKNWVKEKSYIETYISTDDWNSCMLYYGDDVRSFWVEYCMVLSRKHWTEDVNGRIETVENLRKSALLAKSRISTCISNLEKF